MIYACLCGGVGETWLIVALFAAIGTKLGLVATKKPGCFAGLRGNFGHLISRLIRRS